jgi:hypothetical protein
MKWWIEDIFWNILDSMFYCEALEDILKYTEKIKIRKYINMIYGEKSLRIYN